MPLFIMSLLFSGQLANSLLTLNGRTSQRADFLLLYLFHIGLVRFNAIIHHLFLNQACILADSPL